jgi:hypothetical protein
MSKKWHKNPQDSRNWTDRSSPVFNHPANPWSPAGRAAAKQREARRNARRETTMPTEHAPPPSGLKGIPASRCSNCGSENRPTAGFCRSCGHPLGSASPSDRYASPRRHRPSAGIALLVIVIVGGIAGLLVVGFATGDDQPGSVAATVVAGESNIRNDPSTNHDPVDTVAGGTKVRVVCWVGSTDDGWYRLGGKYDGDYIGTRRVRQAPGVPQC